MIDPTSLLPHRPPFLFLLPISDDALSSDGREISCRAMIPPEQGRDGLASSLLGVEIGAQAAGCLGTLASRAEAATEKGYLVLLRSVELTVPTLPTGEPLMVTARSRVSAGPLALFDFSVGRNRKESGLLLRGTIGTYAEIGSPETR